MSRIVKIGLIQVEIPKENNTIEEKQEMIYALGAIK